MRYRLEFISSEAFDDEEGKPDEAPLEVFVSAFPMHIPDPGTPVFLNDGEQMAAGRRIMSYRRAMGGEVWQIATVELIGSP